MNIMIFEPDLNGHHASYLVPIASRAMDCGHFVIICTKPENRNFILKAFGDYDAKQYEIVDMALPKSCNLFGSIYKDFKRELSFRAVFKLTFENQSRVRSIDRIFMPYMDYCLHAIGMLGSPFGKVEFEGICMRPTFHFKTQGIAAPTSSINFIKKILFTRILSEKGLRKIYTIDQTLAHFSAVKHSSDWKKVYYMPEPSDFREKKIKNNFLLFPEIPSSAKVILIFGSLDSRKGIAQLLAGILKFKNAENLHLIFAGKQTDEVRNILKDSSLSNLNFHILDKWIRDLDEEASLFYKADVIWLGYKNHFTMSSILIKAAQYRKPVISCDVGLIAWYTEKYKSGIRVNIYNADDVASAIRTILDSKNYLKVSKWNKHNLKEHEWKNVSKLLFQDGE